MTGGIRSARDGLCLAHGVSMRRGRMRSEPEGVEKVAPTGSMAGELSPIEALAFRSKSGIAPLRQGELVCGGAHDGTPFGVRLAAETLGSDVIHLECSIESESSLAPVKSALSLSSFNGAAPRLSLLNRHRPAPVRRSNRSGQRHRSGDDQGSCPRSAKRQRRRESGRDRNRHAAHGNPHRRRC